MAGEAVIEVYGEDKVLRAVERLAHLDSMAPVMKEAVELVRAKVAAEPGPFHKNRKRWWFMSKKQRGWFFAGVKSGSIHTPYNRTHVLSKGWHGAVKQSPGALEGHVTNTVDYSPWVQDKVLQARVHQKRWPTVQQVERNTEAAVNALFSTAANRWAQGG